MSRRIELSATEIRNKIGHPIFDEWIPTSRTELGQLLHLNEEKPIITLYPGSRIQEINRHLSLFITIYHFKKFIQLAVGI